jgi:hypothetical protein
VFDQGIVPPGNYSSAFAICLVRDLLLLALGFMVLLQVIKSHLHGW